MLGGAAVLAALVCFSGAAVLFFLLRAESQLPDPEPIARPTAAVVTEPAEGSAPLPAGPDIGAWPELTALPGSAEAGLRSAGNGQATQVAFFNTRAEPVTVSWLGPDGKRVQYQVLGPGEAYTQQTYLGHPWVASTADGKAVAVFEPGLNPSRAVIR
ncbi:hypothetical protein AFR_17435 [Actinoplanes friuliensis DSM 7358]|uniref:von Hippel-Lindau disease tumour suppressor beta domain-containing protein n=1 Tax=Actinoplanes friuliensis DSM 7358 TaxID=1246995 RepID=U5W1C2_9ACTN|nr:hypothetical protein AFR_17435 [Actinoplanes friuliensis DSM 7358]